MAYIIGAASGGSARNEKPGVPAGKAAAPSRKSIRKEPGGVVSKKKKGGFTCLACGGKMKRKDAACRRCATPSLLGEARKAMAAAGVTFIGKSMRPRCPRCRATSRPSAKHCTSCGSALLAVVKSAGAQARDGWLAKARAEADPGLREGYWRLANPDIYRTGGAAS